MMGHDEVDALMGYHDLLPTEWSGIIRMGDMNHDEHLQ